MRLRIALVLGAASLTSYLAVPGSVLAADAVAPATPGVCRPSSAPVIVDPPRPSTSDPAPTEPIVGLPLPVAAPGPVLPTSTTSTPRADSPTPNPDEVKPEAVHTGGRLPFTGLDVGLLVGAGALLVIFGATLRLAAPRRSRRRH